MTADPVASRLAQVFQAGSVAIIGASERIHYVGALIDNLRRFGFDEQRIYPVNPGEATVHGLKAYPTIDAVPETPEVAVIARKAEAVDAMVADCGQAGVAGCIVLSSGFGEAGPEGRRRQQQLVATAHRHGMTLLGPSSLGAVSLHDGMAAFASRLPAALRPGNVSAIFQSGGTLNLFLTLLAHRQVGVAKAVVTGNEAVVNLTALLADAVEDEHTGVIAVYLETAQPAAALTHALSRAEELGKPVIVLRAGSSERGRRNVLSHSGNLAGDDGAWTGLLDKHNTIRVFNHDELVDATLLCSRLAQAGDRPTRRRAALMSVSGGDCTLLSDLAQRTGWELPDLPADAHAELLTAVGKATVADNPLDVGGLWRAGRIAAATEVLASNADVDILAVRLNYPDHPAPELLDAYRAVVRLARKFGKVPVALTRASEPLAEVWYELFATLEVPFLHEYERSLQVLAKVSDHYARARRRKGAPARRRQPRASQLLDNVDLGELERSPEGVLSFRATEELLARFGIQTPRHMLVGDAAEAAEAADQLGYPVVLKADQADVFHRSEIGAVEVGLASADAVRQAFARVSGAVTASLGGAPPRRLVLQAQVPSSTELVVGAHVDPDVGPVLVLGLGGRLVELLNDVAIRPVPIDDVDVEEMIAGLRYAALLDGYRGQPAVDRHVLQAAVLRVAELVESLTPDLIELDVNPLMLPADGRGAVAVDVCIRTAVASQPPNGAVLSSALGDGAPERAS